MRIIAGRLGGRLFDSPHSHKTHPMSDKARGALFNILGDISGMSVLDPFAGTGAISFEAVSRGAAGAVAIELDKQAQKVITANIASLGLIHEVKLIVDLIYEGGMANMRYSISNTAEYGDLTRGKRVIGPEVRQAMQKILKDIQSGQFAEEWINEYKAGSPHFTELRKEQANHPLEKVGAGLRSMMPWLGHNRLVDRSKN